MVFLNGESNLLLPVKSSLLLAIFMNKSMLALSFIIFPRNTSTFSYRKTLISKKIYNFASNMEKDRVQGAVECFMQGYGCSQAVVAAFADMYGLDDTMAKRISAGFGGGVGRMRMMCGAASALVVLAGLEKGQTEGNDREGKAECYKLVQELMAKFKERNGSLICAELLKMNGCKVVTDTNIPDERNAEYYKKRPCVRKVESAARIFYEHLEKTL